MELESESFENGAPIPEAFAFGKFHPQERMALSANRNPHLVWDGVPDGAKSFVLICLDPDVPDDRSDFNQADKTLAPDLTRGNFYHWVMVDIPTDCREIDAGACSDGVKSGGKSDPPGPPGSRQGVNDYTGFMQGSEMEGDYVGYDGPCPPWNDEILHHYHFKLFALDIDRLQLGERFTAQAAEQAMADHILAQTELIGTYSLNPEVKDQR